MVLQLPQELLCRKTMSGHLKMFSLRPFRHQSERNVEPPKLRILLYPIAMMQLLLFQRTEDILLAVRAVLFLELLPPHLPTPIMIINQAQIPVKAHHQNLKHKKAKPKMSQFRGAMDRRFRNLQVRITNLLQAELGYR